MLCDFDMLRHASYMSTVQDSFNLPPTRLHDDPPSRFRSGSPPSFGDIAQSETMRLYIFKVRVNE
ncbi:hypothetical protein N7532_010312 [Penicillium argentinense]|uniref:Uncharacterized protein n=1 Tax=Penicillium argentinense TaxID=1131581 RepID=A0A9W9EPM7_9EURO|nr:uncharacterized protein N7532_010312 [Penicillium argentinense]KAJ5085541.1 hypothetical protein N7532_010312 [Penicillium argentinense]